MSKRLTFSQILELNPGDVVYTCDNQAVHHCTVMKVCRVTDQANLFESLRNAFTLNITKDNCIDHSLFTHREHAAAILN